MEAPPEERGLFRGNVEEFNDAVVSAYLQRQSKPSKDGRVELDLSMQRIRVLRPLQLSAPQVTSLDMNGNFLPALHPAAFDAFRLENLNMGANDLTEFTVLPSLTALRSLCLSYNKIKRLHDGFARLSQLEELQLRKNKIDALDMEMFRASAHSLRYLSLACNCIASLPPPRSPLVFPRLAFLCLFGNRIDDAHRTIELLAQLAPNVERLFLSGNHFAADREYRLAAVAAWPKLQWLDWIFVTPEERLAATHHVGRKRKQEASSGEPNKIAADDNTHQPTRT